MNVYIVGKIVPVNDKKYSLSSMLTNIFIYLKSVAETPSINIVDSARIFCVEQPLQLHGRSFKNPALFYS